VINAILKHASPDFIVHSGDLVESGTDTSLWPIFFDAERELLRKAAFYPALGNHDHNAPNFFDYLNAKPYYSFDWGGAHFAVLNSDVGNVSVSQAARDTFWQEQTRWLRDDLKRAASATLRFVVAHHPPITAVKRRQDNNPLMIALQPIFDEYKVTAGFFGHDHNYQHYLQNGVHYFTSGGGGAPLYDVDAPPADITVKVASTENFLVVKVDGGKVHVEAWTPGGAVIDTADFGPSRMP
jgi:3',5'-cyclic AMP phosphodiesterase CpdA